MPNIASAKKRMRQTERVTAVNRARRSRIRTAIKAVETAIAAKDKTAASAALKAAQPEIMRGVTKRAGEEHGGAKGFAPVGGSQGAVLTRPVARRGGGTPRSMTTD